MSQGPLPKRRACAALLVAALGLCTAPMAAGCIFFSSFDGLTGGTEDAGTPDGGDAGCSREFLNLCRAIPRAPNGFVQVVDGDAAEFCDIGADDFAPVDGQFRTCPKPSWVAAAAPHATVRAVWSVEALHVQVRVDKATPVMPNDAGELYKGDAVEIFVGNAEAPTGTLADDHAAQILLAPPAAEGEPGALATGMAFYGEWAARRDEAGYEVEIAIPWSFLGGEIPAAGRGVLWNFAVDVVGSAGERYQSYMRYERGDGETQWCKEPAFAKPSSDDRSWCRSELSP